jgi:excisionase family DNA binding protein
MTPEVRVSEFPPQTGQVLVTAEEAARRLALSRATVFRLLADGSLRSITVGRARRVPVAALVEFVHDRETAQ